MEALAKAQAETADRRDSANAELARQAKALAAAAGALRATEQELAAKQHDLDQLQQQRQELQHKLDGQRAAIAELLRAIYALGRGSDLRLLLGDEDVGRIARALAYSKYFQQDRMKRVAAADGRPDQAAVAGNGDHRRTAGAGGDPRAAGRAGQGAGGAARGAEKAGRPGRRHLPGRSASGWRR